MAILGTTQQEAARQEFLNALAAYAKAEARAVVEQQVREIVREELARLGISMQDGNLTIKAGGTDEG